MNKSKTLKLITILGFVITLFGFAFWMYFKYIHNKPKIEIIAPRTDGQTRQLDSLLKLKPGYNK